MCRKLATKEEEKQFFSGLFVTCLDLIIRNQFKSMIISETFVNLEVGLIQSKVIE